MKTPDKICIFPDDNDEFWYKPEEWKTPPPKRVEYIRKDALLEWAVAKKSELFNGEPTDVAAGINAGLDMIIIKLKSL